MIREHLGRLRSIPSIFLLFLTFQCWALDEPYNRIQALERAPLVDGTITAGEWPEEHMVRLSRIYHEEYGVRLYFAWDQNYLYLGAFVEDADLWADGDGAGAGEYWGTHNDDTITWYFDIDNSRDNHIQTTDRFLALNIGNITDPKNGPGIVSRRGFGNGVGDGNTVGLGGPNDLVEGLVYKVQHYGTVNTPGDVDTGYSMEVAIPWSALNFPPSDGDTMGINAAVFFDDDGGQHDWTDYSSVQMYTEASFLSNGQAAPALKDEYLELRWGSQTSQQGGASGPVNYQIMQFHQAGDITPPDPVQQLTAANARPYSVTLSWLCPGDNGMLGIANGFDIRYSTTLIDESNIDSATRWPARIDPLAPGFGRESRVMGLTPETAYYFAVRAFDEAGNTGPVSVIGPVQTLAVSAAGTTIQPAHYRGAVRPAPGGRYFMTEDGSQFIPIGHHLLLSDAATRHLYTGEVWTGETLWDFSQEEGALQKVTDYLDLLQENGITAARLFLTEFATTPKDDGTFSAENGAHWYEFPARNYNAHMDTFLVDLLRLCSERGIYLAISPFESYYWGTNFEQTMWYAGNGGPLTDINLFYHTPEVLQLLKERWLHVIAVIKTSGYQDAVFGYEVLVEWDSWHWTRPDDSDVANAERLRVAYIEELAAYVRMLDPDRLVISNVITDDPRGPLATLSFYNNVFDVSSVQGYTASSMHSWFNPAPFKGPETMREHARLMAWWTANQLGHKPVLNSEWGPDVRFMPGDSNGAYFEQFTEADDEAVSRVLWFTELCSGASGPGRRLQNSVRAFEKGLFLSDAMHGTMKTVSHFVENGVKDPIFDFRDFPSENIRGLIKIENTLAAVEVTGVSDGEKGLVYLLQDRNVTSGTVSGATLSISGIRGAPDRAEFWLTAPDQTAAAQIVGGAVSGNTVTFTIPDFTQDWAVRFYEPKSTTIPLPAMTTAIQVNGGAAGIFSDQDTQTLSLSVANGGGRSMDTYIALVRPDGAFQCLDGNLQLIDTLNEVMPVVTAYPLPDLTDVPVFTLPIDAELAVGEYTWYLIITEAGTDILDLNNWISFATATWSRQ